jgi:hypothetical protein
MRLSRRTFGLAGVSATICAALTILASPTVAKDPKWVGPVNQPPGGGTFGQASIELKVHFGRKKHGSKKFVPKSLMAKLTNVYYRCADGQIYYPSDGGGDASTSTHISFEETIFVKKNKKFGVTDSSSGDTDSGSLSITGKFHGRTASGTIHMENHRNDGSNHGDYLTCDSGVLSWTASAP